ncbi:uroporphyrinogen decarboxylase family protein [Leptospira borgpetersenii]|uniref:uroporphyrinogen decarboxylase family protein n=1 Tax=Leptospira borgpetersenii TaxID=174 RepID=UPI00187FAE28|nr:uroporphyrinogen decarboxylase family protein [Leptospira borgpetersenii]MBE8362655.1 uroporphyrinogen decarboxylase [Leptospira borgpetersenii serovar Balcanica]MBE8368357.1 uroporphyrinogen decarboxylase [Leptospira borgpetersenii serovar Balcanica]MBE8421710.1 uroporphyrinogen decarboxylase [Leptospira borgpetersenii serovar Balcanica]MBF3348780.1 uroporphyrinogen decarboxylase [Leptospira borgpetersenii serovar Balcanica]MBF3376329.1 uroporphyrinogen decarboxylase [Leptospira borgpeters
MPSKRYSNAISGVAQKIPPVWMMRQAGRYHKHYQTLRQKYTFEELCKNPELAAEVAFGPVDEFDFDVAILFSDILFPLEALGMGLRYTDAGPVLNFSIRSEKDLKKLKPVEDSISFMQFQKKAMHLTRERIPEDKSVIGFVGGPWTLFTYAVSGKHEGNLSLPKILTDVRNEFLEKIIRFLRENISLQLEGGAELVMIFDTAGGDLSPELFREIVIPGIKILADSYPGKVGYYGKGTASPHFQAVQRIPTLAGFGFDHRWDLKEIFKNEKRMVQGNFDQNLLFMEKEEFKRTLKSYLMPYRDLSPEERIGWVCGLGHGVMPKTPEENVKSFVEIVRETFR